MKNMVDVCVGKMSICQLVGEVEYYMRKSPNRLVVDIKKKKGGYYTAIYMTIKDFKEKC